MHTNTHIWSIHTCSLVISNYLVFYRFLFCFFLLILAISPHLFDMSSNFTHFQAVFGDFTSDRCPAWWSLPSRILTQSLEHALDLWGCESSYYLLTLRVMGLQHGISFPFSILDLSWSLSGAANPNFISIFVTLQTPCISSISVTVLHSFFQLCDFYHLPYMRTKHLWY